jgi:hypothetical protein
MEIVNVNVVVAALRVAVVETTDPMRNTIVLVFAAASAVRMGEEFTAAYGWSTTVPCPAGEPKNGTGGNPEKNIAQKQTSIAARFKKELTPIGVARDVLENVLRNCLHERVHFVSA